jgi:hypothetical protein
MKLLCWPQRPQPWYDTTRTALVMVAVIESFLQAGATQPTEDSSLASVRALRSAVVYLLPITFSPRRGLSVFEAKPLSLCAATSFLIAARAPRQLASGPRTRAPLAVDSADVVEAAEHAI